MIHSMPCTLYIHRAFTYIVRRSLKRSVKRTRTRSAISTNESAQNEMVPGSRSVHKVALEIDIVDSTCSKIFTLKIVVFQVVGFQ